MKNGSKPTWKDVVKEALAEIGTSGHLDNIYSKIKGHPKTETNPTWRDTVRRTLQQYSIFYQEEKGSGIWYLREEKPLEEFDPKKNPSPAHEDVQGMLLELGKIYGYETSAAINDAKKKFMNMPIDKMSKFDREIGCSLFRDIKGICRARTYEPLVKLYTLAKEHNSQKTEFLG
ncbi:MAG TPA: hypothetical protein VIO58_07395 [Candidatus Methanoperedens sp.]